MIILSYFNRIIGPKIYLTNPQNLMVNLNEEYLSQIKSLMTSDNTGFFTHNFSPELKTANYTFNLDSKWARGRSELIMISIIISEEEPDYFTYEKLLSKFVEKIKKIPDLFKAFYVNSEEFKNKEDIKEKFKILRAELNNLYKILIIKKIETEGHLISLFKLSRDKKIKLSNELVKKLQNLSNNKQHCFLVFRTRGDALKMDIIPVETDKIFNLIIMFGEQMTVTILQQVSKIFAKYEDNLKLVFTSGLCVEMDKCIYEVYIDVGIDTLNYLIEDLYKIQGIIEMEVKLIETQN